MHPDRSPRRIRKSAAGKENAPVTQPPVCHDAQAISSQITSSKTISASPARSVFFSPSYSVPSVPPSTSSIPLASPAKSMAPPLARPPLAGLSSPPGRVKVRPTTTAVPMSPSKTATLRSQPPSAIQPQPQSSPSPSTNSNLSTIAALLALANDVVSRMPPPHPPPSIQQEMHNTGTPSITSLPLYENPPAASTTSTSPTPSASASSSGKLGSARRVALGAPPSSLAVPPTARMTGNVSFCAAPKPKSVK